MLDETQVAVLEAVVNVIIPPDDYPGGWNGGVKEYLFRQFQTDLKDFVGLYQHGLQAIDAEAMGTSGKPFVQLTPELQESVLQRIEQGQVKTAWPVDAASFFALLVEHCAEGYYCDPGNGGNQDGLAWKMIGFEVTG